MKLRTKRQRAATFNRSSLGGVRPKGTNNRRDPTGTKSMRDLFARRLHLKWEELSKRILQFVGEQDCFGLGEKPTVAALLGNTDHDPETGRFVPSSFKTEDEAQAKFNEIGDAITGRESRYSKQVRMVNVDERRVIQLSMGAEWDEEKEEYKHFRVRVDFEIRGEEDTYQAKELQSGTKAMADKLKGIVKAYHDAGFKIAFGAADERRRDLYSKVLGRMGLKYEGVIRGEDVWNASQSFPIVLQSTDYSCGRACAVAVCRYFGVDAPLVPLSREHGVDPPELAESLREVGLRAEVQENMGVEQLVGNVGEHQQLRDRLGRWASEEDDPSIGWNPPVIDKGGGENGEPNRPVNTIGIIGPTGEIKSQDYDAEEALKFGRPGHGEMRFGISGGARWVHRDGRVFWTNRPTAEQAEAVYEHLVSRSRRVDSHTSSTADERGLAKELKGSYIPVTQYESSGSRVEPTGNADAGDRKRDAHGRFVEESYDSSKDEGEDLFTFAKELGSYEQEEGWEGEPLTSEEEAIGDQQEQEFDRQEQEFLDWQKQHREPEANAQARPTLNFTPEGSVVIALVQTGKEPLGFGGGHWVVVTGVESGRVKLMDPLRGLVSVPQLQFEDAWHDVGADGRRWMRAGIAVSRATLNAEEQPRDTRGRWSKVAGLSFDHERETTEEEPDFTIGGQVTVKDATGKEVGHAAYIRDGMAALHAGDWWAEEGGLDRLALKAGTWRISGIEVRGKHAGKGLGGELYLRAFDAVPGRPYFYNSQSSWSAVAAQQRLAEQGLVELIQNPRNEEQHFIRITEKGQRWLRDEVTLNVSAADLDEAASMADTDPTRAQREAGNYRKGHVRVQGLEVTIETPRGVKRKPWHDKALSQHYGYIKRTTSEGDGEHVDCFIGPDPNSDAVFVVDQLKDDGSFDEHKCLIGWDNAEEAKAAYLANYPDGWQGFGGMTEMTMAEFRVWLGLTDNVSWFAECERDEKGHCEKGTNTWHDCGKDIREAARQLANGNRVRLDQPKQVSTLLRKMAKMAQRAERMGEDAPDFDLCNVSIPGTNLFCVDASTEIMTEDGWKKYTEVSVGDVVLTLNHETGFSEWQPLLKINVLASCTREMLKMEGQRHSSLTTLDHRWPVVTAGKRGAKRRWTTSAELTWDDRIQQAAPCSTLPVESPHDDELVELVAWTLTDGHIDSGTTVRIYQSHAKHPQHCATIRRSLESLYGSAFSGDMKSLRTAAKGSREGKIKLPVAAWRESKNEDTGMTIFLLNAAASAPVLAEMDTDKVVKVSFVRSLTMNQLNLFVQRSLDGDGAKGCIFSQRLEGRNKAFEMACALLGRATNTTSHADKRPHLAHKRLYLTNVLTKLYVSPKNTSALGGRFVMETVRHTGVVWCPTVANGTWLARRRGSVYYTGNCQDTKGIPRVHMPQMRGWAEKGTIAADLPSNKEGKVDVGAMFVAHLQEEGIGVKRETWRASEMRASQSQIVGSRVAQLMKAVKDEGKDLRKRPLFITRDGYVIDGHHNWAALVGLSYERGGKSLKLPVYVLDTDIGTALDMANRFTHKMGLKAKSSATTNEVVKDESGHCHDEKGRWIGCDVAEVMDCFNQAWDADGGDRLTREYLKTAGPDNPDHPGTFVINMDDARELCPEYAESREGRTAYMQATNQTAWRIAQAAYAKALDHEVAEGHSHVVVFTAGGPGSGKSSGLGSSKSLSDTVKNCHVLFDSSEAQPGMIRAALDHGLKVHVIYTYRDAEDAFANGVLPRAMEMGRPVSARSTARLHVAALNGFEQDRQLFKDDPNVAFSIIDNSRGRGKATVVDSMPQGAHRDEAALRERLKRATEDAYRAGKIDSPLHRATLELQAAGRGPGAGDGSQGQRVGNVGEHQQLRDRLGRWLGKEEDDPSLGWDEPEHFDEDDDEYKVEDGVSHGLINASQRGRYTGWVTADGQHVPIRSDSHNYRDHLTALFHSPALGMSPPISYEDAFNAGHNRLYNSLDVLDIETHASNKDRMLTWARRNVNPNLFRSVRITTFGEHGKSMEGEYSLTDNTEHDPETGRFVSGSSGGKGIVELEVELQQAKSEYKDAKAVSSKIWEDSPNFDDYPQTEEGLESWKKDMDAHKEIRSAKSDVTRDAADKVDRLTAELKAAKDPEKLRGSLASWTNTKGERFYVTEVGKQMEKADAALGKNGDEEVASAVDAFIGMSHRDARSGSVAAGVMRATPLETIVRDPVGHAKELADLETAFKPVKDALRKRFGSHVTLYRFQTADTDSKPGVIRGSAPEGERFTLSFTADPKFAAWHGQHTEGKVEKHRVNLDDVLWVSDRANQMEFIVKPRPGTMISNFSPEGVANTRFAAHSPEAKLKSFADWLRTQFASLFLNDDEDRLWQEYSKQGYERGQATAKRAVEKKAAKAKGTKADVLGGISSSLGRPVAVEKVKALARRSFDDLKNVTHDVGTRIQRKLLDGLVQGRKPKVLAKELDAELHLGRHRSFTIAHTELSRAASEGTLDQLESMGVEEVGAAVELETANNDTVCERCQALDGVVLTIAEARGVIPVHPCCACGWAPANVGEPSTGQIRSKSAIDKAFKAGGIKGKVAKSRPESVLNGWDDVSNTFCPTGKGGGVDATCGKGESLLSQSMEKRAKRLVKSAARFKEDHADYLNNLAREDRLAAEAVKRYAGLDSSAYPLNGRMRRCPPNFECLPDDPTHESEISRQFMEDMVRAVEGAPLLPEPVTVYRGIDLSGRVYRGKTGKDQAEELLEAAKAIKGSGDEFRMPSFTSSSLDPKEAADLGGKSITFRILAKSGLYVESVSSQPEERELVQSPNTRYRVKHVIGHVIDLEEIG